MTNDAPRQLHDKATRGEPLTAEEETALAAWCEEQDQEETAMLLSFSKPFASTVFRDEIESALVRLEATAR